MTLHHSNYFLVFLVRKYSRFGLLGCIFFSLKYHISGAVVSETGAPEVEVSNSKAKDQNFSHHYDYSMFRLTFIELRLPNSTLSIRHFITWISHLQGTFSPLFQLPQCRTFML
jgi:hypothetical protein